MQESHFVCTECRKLLNREFTGFCQKRNKKVQFHISQRLHNRKSGFQVTGKHPQIVLDPTLLANWEVNVDSPVKKKDYILFYYCEHLPVHIKTQIFDYAHKNGLAVYGAGDSDKDYDECTVNLTPEEWVAMFKNARFVFTGTFHGVIFSILNHRQFKVYLTNKGRIAKVGNLLSYFQ